MEYSEHNEYTIEDERSAASERSVNTSFRHSNHPYQQNPMSRLPSSTTLKHPMIELDSNVQCTPAQFEEQWKLLLLSSDSSFDNIKVGKMPQIEECSNYFTKRRVYTVASGMNGKTCTIFLIGQEASSIVKFLVQMSINTKNGRLSLKVKSNDPTAVPSFLQVLQLNELFDIKPTLQTA